MTELGLWSVHVIAEEPFAIMEKWDPNSSSVCRSVNVMLVVSACCCSTLQFGGVLSCCLYEILKPA